MSFVRVVDSLSCEGVTFEEVCVSEGVPTPWHDHDTAYLDLYLSGAAKVSWQTEPNIQSVSIVPPGLRHRTLTLAETHTFQVIVQSPPRSLRPAVFAGSRPRHIAQAMYNCFVNRDDLSGLELMELLADFWVASGAVPARAGGSANCAWLRNVEELLRESYFGPPTPRQLAYQVGIHPAHLMREFRRVHRCTMGQYLRSVRIEKACGIVRATSLSLSKVAHSVGFADQSHFNRNFKRCMGVTPSEYRDALRRPYSAL